MAGIICERCKQEIKNPFDPVPIGEYVLFKCVGGYAAVTLCDNCRKELTKIVQVFLGGNGMTEQLLKRAERLDYIYSTGLMSIATYRHMVDELLQEELTHNDT